MIRRGGVSEMASSLQLLGTAGVDFQIIRLGVFADDHADVDRNVGVDEHRTAVFQFPQRIGDGGTVFA